MVERLRIERVDTPEFLDTLYGLLADSARRNVLEFLLARREPVSVRQLAAELAGAEYGTSADDATEDQIRETLLLLKHVQLPMLRDAGAIEWDRDADLIALTEVLDQVSVTVSNAGGLVDASVSARREAGY